MGALHKADDPTYSHGDHFVPLHGYKSGIHIWTTVLLVWVLALVFISEMQKLYFFQDENVVVPPLIRVTVFYEALCPDSRDFVVRQLLPAYRAMGDVINVELVPYGKAQSSVSSSGRKTFTCQHGPKECKANIVHACVAQHVKEEQKKLDIIECMIKINYIEDPIEAGRKCLMRFEEDSEKVEKCSTGEEGEELHYHMGKMTHDLDPKVSFIPTITINNSQKQQELILKNLIKKLCFVLTGPRHPACGS